uniref:Protein FAR1-related sequence 5-like n=1 Tax=Tanacetum cinerariifolium TaxID=118510 RepID=A0A6L2LTK3_TANCI|nr:protein FAR1-related sequence 5-like [Tanacetum cinerariifolium]
METDLELKNIDDNQLKEADMVVDDENNLVDTEIQKVDGNIDEEEKLIATIVPQTPRPSLYLHSETPGGSVYWEPNIESIYLPIEEKVFYTIEECVDFYTFYAEIGESHVIFRYDMVFVPFTRIDNHGKCVTVGSRLLLREETEAYTWLLRSFMTAYEKQPTMIVTDQDGAMKLAIEEVLTESIHRLCMWHIMQKIPAKICIKIYDEIDFKERFNKIVWNMFMEPMEFEEKWSKLIEDFGLQNHEWMTVRPGFENCPPMVNKENYVPWSSRLIQYAKSRPNGKLIHNSIIHGPYVRRMIPEPCDPDREVLVNETFHVQTDDELTEKELKQIEVDDQAIQTILLGLPEDIYATVDSYETAQEIWLRVQQMMKGPDIEIQEKKAKLFNEWERFTSTDGNRLSIQAKLLNTNQQQPEDFIKPRNRQIAQPDMNLGQDRQMQMVEGNGGNQFRQYAGKNVGNLNGYNAVQNVRNQNPNENDNLVAARAESNANGHNGNQMRCYNCRGLGHLARNCNVRPRRRDAAYFQTQLLIAQKEEAGIQLQAKKFDLMAAAADLDEIEEVNANCILMANLQQASTSGTHTDKAPVYDSDGSAEVQNYKNCYDNEIFNMFTQEEQYSELLEPNSKPHQVPQNDNNVISEVSSVEQSGGTLEQHPANVEETCVLYDSLYNNLAIEVEKVNTVNCKLRETNAELTTELARYKNQKKCFEISQEKYDKLERCYQKSVYQEQCLSKKINALHLSSADESLAKNKALELEIEHLLRAVVSQDIMSVVQNNSVGDISNLHTELELPSNSIPTPQESKVVKNDEVIAPGMFRINPFKPSREEKYVPNKEHYHSFSKGDYLDVERIDLTPGPPPNNMLPPRESPNCFRATRKRFFSQKEFSSDIGYLSRSFRNSIIDDGIIKDLTFSNSVCILTRGLENKENMCTNEICINKKKEKDCIEELLNIC